MGYFSRRVWSLSATAGLLLASCQSKPKTSAEAAAAGVPTETVPADTASVAAPADGITAGLLQHHTQVLASDAFEGRRPFTAGEEKATRYLAAEFRKLGLQPGPNGTYFQSVPLVEIAGMPAPVATIVGHGNHLTLQLRTDYVVGTGREVPSVTLTDSPLVFAGYGVVAPEYKWDDYAGLDCRGKTVVVLNDDPGNAGTDTTLFKGKALTLYSGGGYKGEAAARHGAAALLVIYDTRSASTGTWNWMNVQTAFNTPIRLEGPDRHASKLALGGQMTPDAAKRLFAAAGQNYAAAYTAANKPGFRARLLGLTLALVKSLVQRLIGKLVNRHFLPEDRNC